MCGAKLRLRARKPVDSDNTIQRRRIAKRNPPRGINKRRRAMGDDAGREDSDDDEDNDNEDDDDDAAESQAQEGPRTPKRARMSSLVPEILPLGLERGDFWSLHSQGQNQSQNQNQNSASSHGPWQDAAHQQHQFSTQSFFPSFSGLPQYPGLDSSRNGESSVDDDNNNNNMMRGAMDGPEADLEWTSEEDRVLVELVLEKLKLTKSEWADCARSLGRDRGSVGRRWRSLMGGGEVGLKRRGGARKGIHATWR